MMLGVCVETVGTSVAQHHDIACRYATGSDVTVLCDAVSPQFCSHCSTKWKKEPRVQGQEVALVGTLAWLDKESGVATIVCL